MRNKMIYLILSFLIIASFFYWIYFIRSQKVNDSNFVKLCKLKVSPVSLRIDLVESSKYISFVEHYKEQNVLYLEVYTTSVFNLFASNKKASFEIRNVHDIKEIVILNKKYDINLMPECR